ncbi:MAG: ATP-binding cassette domain-containing protein [Bradymonadales bacterium]|nr:MAG: ATP-binding cassette domain-containing protein [Bradymonadales bacterium]
MIELKSVSKSFSSQPVLSDLSLQFEEAKTHVLLGSSGCGKSTLLRMIIGLTRPDEGEVHLETKPLSAYSLFERSQLFGYVIQKFSLFPHFTAFQNVELPARCAAWSPQKVKSRIDELSELVQLEPEMLEKYPFQLSGGQQQRVSLMRALILNPPYLLMDEPLSALDPLIRGDLQEDLLKIFRRLEKTVVFVTHDLREAVKLGHKIYLLNEGQIVQSGLLEDFQSRPASEFVSRFVQSQRSAAS